MVSVIERFHCTPSRFLLKLYLSTMNIFQREFLPNLVVYCYCKIAQDVYVKYQQTIVEAPPNRLMHLVSLEWLLSHVQLNHYI